MKKDVIKMIKKVSIFILLFLCIFSYSNVKASDEYLPITYKTVRYTGGNNTGTTIWYSIIPAKYKMHYAYANDLIGGKVVDGETKLGTETPSTNAIRHNATLGINTQYMGLVDYNGTLLGKGTDVSQYDFYMKPNTTDNYNGNAANMYAVSPTSTKVGIDLSYAVNPKWCEGMCFVTMIRNGVRDYTDENNYQGDGDLSGARHPRTWIAIDSEGNQFVAVAAGRNEPLNGNDFSLTQAGLNFDEIIAATKAYFTTDILYLYNLDGGGSSSFVYKGTMLNPKYDKDSTDTYFKVERKTRGIFYWKVDNYNISYDLNGGSIPSNKTNPSKYNVDTNTITLNNPTKTGYTFTGWTGANGNTPQTNVKIANGSIGNKSYIANWEKIPDKHIISFDSNGGSDVDEIAFTDDGHISEPATPKKEGYTFGGWYEDENFTKKFDFSKLPEGDITLYAKWIKKSNNTWENLIGIPNTGLKGTMALSFTIGLILITLGGIIVYKNIKSKENKM